jgi:thioredoxin-related protein
MNRCDRSLLIISCCLISACSVIQKKDTEQEKPFGETGIPPQLRGQAEQVNPTVAGEIGTPASEVAVALANHPSAENILWTDADAEGKSLPELDRLLSAPKRGIWEKNEEIAKRSAIREGKCILIWFTDSVRSPLCKSLSEELFGRKEFGDWAKDHLVRLVVDQSAMMAKGEKYDNEVGQQEYVEMMKKRYKSIGTPNCILLSPKGEVLGKFRGYKKGQAEFFWGQLKYNCGVGEAEYDAWAKKLEKQGFRRWQDKENHRVLAKLVTYDKGTLVMVEPDGSRFRTNESKLSDADQDWIKAEKKKRGIQ